MKSKNIISQLIVASLLFSCQPRGSRIEEETEKQSIDPLTSWSEGSTKQDILQFVKDVTDPNNDHFIPEEERIAVFDNDGTLWSEQPVYFQLYFIFDRIRQLAPQHPEWNNDKLFRAVLENDLQTVMESGVQGLLSLAMVTHSGMTAKEFEKEVKNWIATAKHPETGRLFTEMVYQPMLEVLDYLRSNGFKTYIVSGGGIDFMRPWTAEVYGIPPEQVIGSSVQSEFIMTESGPAIVKLPRINFINDKEGKPVGIYQHIGRRSVAAFGNSDGDLAMLQWTSAGEGKRLMVYIHHTDAEREWAYDRESHIGHLDAGLDEAIEKEWTIVDMKKDWKRVYK
jgi:hypothetical protein